MCAGSDDPRKAGRFRRRRGEFAASSTVVDMVGYLMSRPSSNAIAQHLVLRLLPSYHVRGAVISVFGIDGSLNEVGIFGLTPTEAQVVHCLALGDRTPLTDAARSGEPVVYTSGAAAKEHYPWLEHHLNAFDPIAAWPLMLPDESVGALQLTFVESPDEEQLRADVGGIAAVLALYVSLLRSDESSTSRLADGEEGLSCAVVRGSGTWFTPAVDGDEPTPDTDGAVASSDSLTRRQVRILDLLSDGLTHLQISNCLGFSESTIRHESMIIYRHLGVPDRREAVRAGRLRGLVAPPSS